MIKGFIEVTSVVTGKPLLIAVAQIKGVVQNGVYVYVVTASSDKVTETYEEVKAKIAEAVE